MDESKKRFPSERSDDPSQKPSPSRTIHFGRQRQDILGSGVWNTANRLGRPEIGEQFLEDVSEIVGGRVRRYEKGWPDVIGADGRALEAAALLKVSEQWKEAMRRFITELQETIA
jgi:hypothetical protein